MSNMDIDNVFLFRDLNGCIVIIHRNEVVKALMEDAGKSAIKIVGLSLSEIMALVNAYRARKGTLPVTHERINEAFPPHANLAKVLETLTKEIHRNAVDHGFWDEDKNDGECIALMHSELSEALEALRHDGPASDHIPQFLLVEEELADVIIRVLDFCRARGYRIGDALVAKMEFNAGRPYKHGKKF